MKELGESAERWHRTIGEAVNNLAKTDVVFVGSYGESFLEGLNTSEFNVTVVPSVDELEFPELVDYESALVKGSNSVGLNQILEEWRNFS